MIINNNNLSLVALLLIFKYTRPCFTISFSQNDKGDLNNS